MEQLVRSLSRLPGIGKRSAERIGQRLVTDPKSAQALKDALRQVEDHLCQCSSCGYITGTDENPCGYCSNPNREGGLMCIVESPVDVDLMESSGSFAGRYFCLLGKISPGTGEAITDDRVRLLVKRIRDEKIGEVLLALNADVESDATAHYLSEVLHHLDVKVSRLALGIPAGSGLAYSDPVTLARAISARQEM